MEHGLGPPVLRNMHFALRTSLLPPAARIAHAPTAALQALHLTGWQDSMSMELNSRSAVRDSSYAFRLRRRCPPSGAPPHPFVYG